MAVQETAPSGGTEDFSNFFDETPGGPVFESGSSVMVVLRMVLVLALAALAIYGVVFFVKRLARPQENQDPHLKILARAPLSSDTFAAVISVGTKAWLVAGGAGVVNLVSEIDEVEARETMLLEDARRTAEMGNNISFRSLLQRLSPARGEKNEAPGGSRTETLRKQLERLRGL